MNTLSEYVILLSGASIVVGVILSFVKDSSHEGLFRLICGVFLTLSALSLISGISLPDIPKIMTSASQDAQAAISYGEKSAQEALSGIIKQETEAYILTKAADRSPGLEVRVQVRDHLPYSVSLYGEISPSAKAYLSGVIERELGIPKERQQWIGRN